MVDHRLQRWPAISPTLLLRCSANAKARFPCEQKRARVRLLKSHFNTNNVYRLHERVSARLLNARGKKSRFRID